MNGRESVCAACEYNAGYLVKEIEGQLITRCPRCGSYAWRPKPPVLRADLHINVRTRGSHD